MILFSTKVLWQSSRGFCILSDILSFVQQSPILEMADTNEIQDEMMFLASTLSRATAQATEHEVKCTQMGQKRII